MLPEKIKNLLSPQQDITTNGSLPASVKLAYNSSRSPGAAGVACYAPLKNMYFGHHGKMVACCYNRQHELGTYPHQSIKDSWFGEKAEQLRDSLKAYNFPMGCENCLKELVAGNFDGSKAKQYDGYKMNANKFPAVMEFELENTCNLECIMCSGDYSSLIRTKREKRPELFKPYGDEFISQLEEFIPYLEEVKFYGGEPFLIPVYYKIWDKIIALKPQVRIFVQTNGTTLNNRVKEILQKADFNINLSLDSLDKTRYEAIRVNAGFDTVMENMHYFYQYCLAAGTSFGISTCLMQNNWFEAPAFVRLCNQLNVALCFHTVYYPDFLSLRRFTPVKLKEVYDTLLGELETLPGQTLMEKKNKKHYHDFILQILAWSQKADINPETEHIHSVAQLSAFLIKKTWERKDIDEPGKKEKAEKIEANMHKLAAIMPAGFAVNALIRDVKTSDAAAMFAYLEAAENGTPAEAVKHLQLQGGEFVQHDT